MPKSRSIVDLNDPGQALTIFQVVGVRRRVGKLDFRTAVIPTQAYLRNLRKGELLWRA